MNKLALRRSRMSYLLNRIPILALIAALFVLVLSTLAFGQNPPSSTTGNDNPNQVYAKDDPDLLSSPSSVPIEEILQGLMGRNVYLTGVVQQWASPSTPYGPVQFYLLKGSFGDTVWVRTNTQPPGIYEHLALRGLVIPSPDPSLTTNAIVAESSREVKLPISSPPMAPAPPPGRLPNMFDLNQPGQPYKMMGVIIAIAALIVGLVLILQRTKPAAH